MTITEIIKISRPKFWLYTAGPFLVGYAAAAPSLSVFLNFQFWIRLIYFLIPANIYLYGINDLFDTDTDQFNPKKGTKESRFLRSKSTPLIIALGICTIITICYIQLSISITEQRLLMIFFLLSTFYSAPPLRFKASPIVDFTSNVLYIIPGLIGYNIIIGQLPPVWAIIGGWCWSGAMHLYSAIPDINADTKANLNTSAVTFGKTNSMIICSVLWMISFIALAIGTNIVLALPAITYPAITIGHLLSPNWQPAKVYWIFPKLNAAMGCYLFWVAILG